MFMSIPAFLGGILTNSQNCAYTVKVSSSPNLSFGQAKNLADELSEINDTLSAEQQPLIKWEESLYADMLKHMPFADFLILSPDKNVKKMNDKNYYNSIANISRSNNININGK